MRHFKSATIGALCVFFAAHLPAYAGPLWLLGTGADDNLLVLDTGSVKQIGATSRIWMYAFYPRPNDEADIYSATLWEVDCTLEKFRASQVVTYKPNSPGELYTRDTPWVVPVPATNSTRIVKEACHPSFTQEGMLEGSAPEVAAAYRLHMKESLAK